MIRPLRGFVLIELIEESEKEVGGIVIPEKTQERQAKGKVISVGKPDLELIKLIEDVSFSSSEGFAKDELEIKKGDVVWFKRFAGEKVKDNEKDYLIVPYKEILGKVYE